MKRSPPSPPLPSNMHPPPNEPDPECRPHHRETPKTPPNTTTGNLASNDSAGDRTSSPPTANWLRDSTSRGRGHGEEGVLVNGLLVSRLPALLMYVSFLHPASTYPIQLATEQAVRVLAAARVNSFWGGVKGKGSPRKKGIFKCLKLRTYSTYVCPPALPSARLSYVSYYFKI
ncbi:hypothetical protein CDEST_06093 [Colletotrichum destructivum]|uniref:Uncharacterized protein n=1 Tax=Colletotrichum destructivum TaxID=34406 RepID=A0AAX4ICJ8_9PEZI|nr:hypothetical protein CDEST_06093 [Colletotrichum destructivum]